MRSLFSTPGDRTRTFILLGICIVLAIVAAVFGIDDNPPGILSAILSAISLVLAFVHPWQTAKQFRSLFFAAVLGFVLLVILNNLSAYIAHDPDTTGTPQTLWQGVAVTAFLIGTLLCPASFLVGAAGWIVMAVRSRRQSK